MSPADREAVLELASTIRVYSRLIFAGLISVVAALLLVAFSGGGDSGVMAALSDRGIHYIIMIGVVLLYVFLQRR